MKNEIKKLLELQSNISLALLSEVILHVLISKVG